MIAVDVVVEAPDIVAAYELRLRLGAAADVEAHGGEGPCEVRIAVASDEAVVEVVREVQAWLEQGRRGSVWIRYGERRAQLAA